MSVTSGTAPIVGFGGDVASSADRGAVSPGHGRGADREGGLTSEDRVREVLATSTTWVRLSVSEVSGRASAHLHVSATSGDQEDRAGPTAGSHLPLSTSSLDQLAE